jgi:hypothetical protein
MSLIVIAQLADQDTSVVRIIYNDLHAAALSRTTIAGGLGVLEDQMVERVVQSNFTLCDFNPVGGYALLPSCKDN